MTGRAHAAGSLFRSITSLSANMYDFIVLITEAKRHFFVRTRPRYSPGTTNFAKAALRAMEGGTRAGTFYGRLRQHVETTC